MAPSPTINTSYTVLVRFFRIGLPVVAILCMVALFIWANINQERVPDEEVAPSTEAVTKPVGVDDDALALTKPIFTGLDRDNHPYTITADTVFQGTTKNADMTLVNPTAKIELSDKEWINLSAAEGEYSPSGQALLLMGRVMVNNDAGYQLSTDAVNVDLNKGTAKSVVPVSGHGPMGTIQAQGLEIDQKNNTVIFNGPGILTLNTDEAL